MDASKGGQAVSHIVDAHVAYIKTISDLNQDKAELQDRIKRLEEAGDALKAAGYFGGWADAVNKWNKSKEAKP